MLVLCIFRYSQGARVKYALSKLGTEQFSKKKKINITQIFFVPANMRFINHKEFLSKAFF